MVYLIMAFNSDESYKDIKVKKGKNIPSKALLKIGYTRDGNLKQRISNYGIPGIRVL